MAHPVHFEERREPQVDIKSLDVVHLKALLYDQAKLLEQVKVNITILEGELASRTKE